MFTSALPEHMSRDGWPVTRLVGDEVAVVASQSARPHTSVLRADGHVERTQLDALRRVLAEPRMRERYVIVAIHHALRRPDGTRDSAHHGLENADDVLDAITTISHGCVVHGLIHARFALRIHGVRATILGAGSATDEGEEGLWMLDVERDAAHATPGWYDGRNYRLDECLRIRI